MDRLWALETGIEKAVKNKAPLPPGALKTISKALNSGSSSAASSAILAWETPF